MSQNKHEPIARTRGTEPEETESWASAEFCTLPSADRPLRVAEFDALFASSARSMDRLTHNRIRICIDADAEQAMRGLAEREVACCSFFSFEFSEPSDGRLAVEIAVPPERTDVLDALSARIRDVS